MIKGIKIEYEPAEGIQRLISDYTQAVSEFLNIAFNDSITSIKKKKLNRYR
jgi:hypothetical protein